jgi:hypothetical protein
VVFVLRNESCSNLAGGSFVSYNQKVTGVCGFGFRASGVFLDGGGSD